MADIKLIKQIMEAVILTSDEPVNLATLRDVLSQQEDTQIENAEIKKIITDLIQDYQGKGVELIEVASGYRFQARAELTPWLQRLMQEKPPKYTRATLETLAIIAYRQPVTRGEIEAIRGVNVSTQTIKTLEDRNWIKVVGQKEVPGRPALYATTKAFLDYFNLKALSDLPELPNPASETVSIEQLGFNLNKPVEVDNIAVENGNRE